MTEKEYLTLCEKYLDGASTPEEDALLKAYQEQHKLAGLPWFSDQMGDRDEIRRILATRLQESIVPHHEIIVSRFRWQYAAAAAVIFCFISIGIYLAMRGPADIKPIAKMTVPVKNDIAPGSNKAILTLADGSKIILDSAKKGVLSRQGKTAVTKAGDGLIVYNSGASASVTVNPLNTITIPRGGRYQIVLPDATKVWLNSSSSLTFPAVFSGAERDVSLTGEAYFEVTKNKDMPFKVKLNNHTEVKVLGTHFNIMAYDDEKEIKTTLLEGSVKFSNNDGAVLLEPGQQGTIARAANSAFKVYEVNTAEAVAWKNGNFMFVNADVKTIMRQISRWYDVNIDYTDYKTNRTFTGTISQLKNVSEVLNLIQLTGAVHFKIAERRIIVMN